MGAKLFKQKKETNPVEIVQIINRYHAFHKHLNKYKKCNEIPDNFRKDIPIEVLNKMYENKVFGYLGLLWAIFNFFNNHSMIPIVSFILTRFDAEIKKNNCDKCLELINNF